jgi:hypothetical protein
MRRGTVLVGIVVVACALTAAFAMRDEEPREPILVDERQGILGRVAFGDTAADVRARRGEPNGDGQGFFPEGSAYTGPVAIPSPSSDQRPPRSPLPLHYDRTAYLISPTVGVFSMAALERGARTRAGVAIGDELSVVRDRYGRAHCSEVENGEGHA